MGDTIAYGYYDTVAVPKKVTTTVTSLSKKVGSDDGVTTTMFLVKIL